MRFVLASHNQKKLKEISDILRGLSIAMEPLPIDAPEPVEDGESFEENALIKARAAFALTGLPAIADDSGLAVDALDGAPGIYSARYCEGSDKDRNALLLQNMTAVPEEKRTARFICAAACVLAENKEFVVCGACEGVILREAHGDGGFGYDPLFYVPRYDCTFGELPAEVKNKISHRALALCALAQELEKQL